ncbi:MAG: DUF2357 domain-containing protein [Candidatus Enteromonas sp.]|nr:DUF2357 domain-containing protein [Candidatus Enteromonas sp.]
MKKKTSSSLSRATQNYRTANKALLKNKSFASFVAALQGSGKTKFFQKRRTEVKTYDDEFISRLEKGFEAIDSIILNPRSFIRESPELVDAGRAKKINSQSVSHLASHTQYVYEVKDNGDVTPMKILTVNSEVDFQIYENRFVYSLIQKAALFIEKRFQYIKSHGETRDSEVLILQNETEIDGARYEMFSRIKVSTPSSDEGKAEKNEESLLRLSRLRERAAYYRKSSFAESLKGSKPVNNPIHMTNMIVKEPHYHACYELWNFLDSYSDLGVSFDVKETEQEFTEEDISSLYCLLGQEALSLSSSLISSRQLPEGNTKAKNIRPKITFSLEEETFDDGRYIYEQFPEGLPPLSDLLAPARLQGSFPSLEEAKAERLALEARQKEYKTKRALVDMAIEEAKAKEVARLAAERAEALKEEQLRQEKEEENRRLRERRREAILESVSSAILASQEKMEEERMRALRKAIRMKALADAGYDPYSYSDSSVLPLSEVPSSHPAKEEEPISSPVTESAPEEHDVPSFARKKSVVRKIYKTRDGKVLTKEEYERMRAEMKAKAMGSDETKPSRLEGGEDER